MLCSMVRLKLVAICNAVLYGETKTMDYAMLCSMVRLNLCVMQWSAL